MVRALASHRCGPGSNPSMDAICGLSLLLVLSFASRGFSPGTPVFPSPQKPTFPNFNSTRNRVDIPANTHALQARNQDFMWGGGGVLTRPKWTKLPKCIFLLSDPFI